jgi:putative tryptophan/tyrosine transport system substrate-binding protein
MAIYIGRRRFIVMLGGAPIALLGGSVVERSPSALAQQVGNKPPRIGIINVTPTLWNHFRQGLRDLGYIEGRNIVLEYRSAEGDFDRLRQVARELALLPVDVIVVYGSNATRAVRQVTPTIPIVMIGVGDPVRARFVTNLARPDGNITGPSNLAPDLIGKRIDILKECVPNLARVAFLWNPDNDSNLAFLEELIIAVPALGLQLISVPVRTGNDFVAAFAAMMERRPNAFVTTDDVLILQHMGRVIDFMAQHRLPAMYGSKEDVKAGGLMSYGAIMSEQYRRGAWYVHRILQGAKPMDLPIEQPTKFELSINLGTAKAIGLDIPAALLARADEVIE